MFDKLTDRINAVLTEKSPVIVGISGFAGAGKTHLAERLADYYKISDGQVIHLDNLYTPFPRAKGLFGDYDWSLLEHILQDTKKGKALDYQGTDFEGRPYPWRFEEEVPRVLLVEGIRLYRPDHMENFDLSVWINCPAELALRRAKERDRQQGHDEHYMKRWDTEWGPQNQEYFDTYRPDKLVDILYEDFGA